MSEEKDRREPIPKKELLRDTTPVPNVIIDVWLPHLSPAETKVVFYIARRTRGWSRDWDQLSVQQIMTGIVRKDGTRLDSGIGLRETACREALRSLVKRGALRREAAVSQTGKSEPPWYSLNLSWTPEGVSGFRQGRVSEKRQGEGVGIPAGVGVSENRTHKKNSPISSLSAEGEVGEVSGLVSCSQKERGEQKTTPQTSSSSSGKETADDASSAKAKNAEPTSSTGNSSQQEKGGEGVLSDWRQLDSLASSYVLDLRIGTSDFYAEGITEEFAEELGLEHKKEAMTRVFGFLADRYSEGAYDYVFCATERCAAECEAGNVRNPWAYLLTSLVAEIDETLQYVGPSEASKPTNFGWEYYEEELAKLYPG